MDKRILGRTPVGLGNRARLHGHEPELRPNPGDRQEMIALIRAAVDRGVTFFDTAEVYGPFDNEELVGEALAPLRDQVVIATKFGFAFDDEGKPDRLDQPTGAHHAGRRAARSGGSAIDVIDLYYQHRVDPDVPIEDVAGAVEELIAGRQGQALRHVRGRRRHHPPRPRRAAGHRRAERVLAVVATARGRGAAALAELGIGFVPYSPLGKGFLTGTIDQSTAFTSRDIRTTIPRFTEENRRANQALVDSSAPSPGASRPRRRRSRSPGCSPSTPWIVPIPGTRRLERLEENIGAVARRAHRRRPRRDRDRRRSDRRCRAPATPSTSSG